MFTEEDQKKIAAIADNRELLPSRLQDHSVALIMMILENGREQRYLGGKPTGPSNVAHEDLVSAVRELRWEGYIDIEKEDIDGDEIPDDVMETGWTINSTGLELLCRLKEAAGFEN